MKSNKRFGKNCNNFFRLEYNCIKNTSQQLTLQKPTENEQ